MVGFFSFFLVNAIMHMAGGGRCGRAGPSGHINGTAFRRRNLGQNQAHFTFASHHS